MNQTARSTSPDEDRYPCSGCINPASKGYAHKANCPKKNHPALARCAWPRCTEGPSIALLRDPYCCGDHARNHSYELEDPAVWGPRAFSASVFCHFEGKVLLIQHKLLGVWLPLGGELGTSSPLGAFNYPEQPLEAARREAREEAGFELQFIPRGPRQPFGTPPGFLGYEEHPAGPKGWHMNFVFLADVISPPGIHPIPKGDGSWSDYRWIWPDDPTFYADMKMPANVKDCLSLIASVLR